MSQMSDANKDLTKLFFEDVLNNQKLNLIPKALHPDYHFNGQPQSADDNAKWVQGLHTTFPNLHFTLEAILAEDDQVAVRWRLEAPAAGQRPGGMIRGTNIIRFQNGQAIDNQQNSGRTSPLNGF